MATFMILLAYEQRQTNKMATTIKNSVVEVEQLAEILLRSLLTNYFKLKMAAQFVQTHFRFSSVMSKSIACNKSGIAPRQHPSTPISKSTLVYVSLCRQTVKSKTTNIWISVFMRVSHLTLLAKC